MSGSTRSVRFSDYLNSSTEPESPKTTVSHNDISSIEKNTSRNPRPSAQEASLTHPPRRFSAVRSLSSVKTPGQLSGLHATPTKRHTSRELRESLAKLESLLQEASRLADSVIADERENLSGERKNVAQEQELGALSSKQKDNASPVPQSLNIAQPRTTKGADGLLAGIQDTTAPVLVQPNSKNEQNADFSLENLTIDHVQNSEAVAEWNEDRQAATTQLADRQSLISPQHAQVHGEELTLGPDVLPRSSSLSNRQTPHVWLNPPAVQINGQAIEESCHGEVDDFHAYPLASVRIGHERHYSNIFGIPSRQHSINLNHPEPHREHPKIDLRKKSYIDVYNKGANFDVHQTCHHATIARNWPNSRKRFAASIACANAGCISLLLGIYAGEVPAIQYAIADFGNYTVLGNVLMYLGLAWSVLVLWPLPLLHGRKPYTVAAQILAMVLQVPQGLAVDGWRDPSQPAYKCLLLISRGASGLALGLADMNIKATLLDCFGASLQSQSSVVGRHDNYDVRHHGGGIGLWLAFLSWGTIGPISIGFMLGASIIGSGASVAWGFWISLCIVLVTLLFNTIMPEVRRSAFRRTVAELIGDAGEFSRVTRGEIKMHLTLTGPY